MPAGQLNRRVTLQSPTKTRGADFSDPQTTWSTAATVWAAVEPLRGREYVAQMEQQLAVEVRVRIRYRADVDSTWRVGYGSKVYEIVTVIDVKSAHDQLELMCREHR